MKAVLILLAFSATGDLADPDEAVTAGSDALGEWAGYPWYDSASDSVRRIDVQPPAPPSASVAPSGPDLDWIGTAFQWTAVVLVLALLGVLVFFLVRSFLDRGYDQAGALQGDDADDGQDEQARVEALPFPVKSGKLDLLEQARQHYRQGNFGQAIVFLFSFQLVQLDKHQVIRLSKGKTNRQYLREVGPRETLRTLVAQTMITFEDAFFGNHSIDRIRFEACWSRVNEFQQLVGQSVG